MKTSTILFCDIHVEQILEHSVKDRILNDILTLTGLRFQNTYSKKITKSDLGILTQPHILSLSTRGRGYWMYCTRINNTEYCILIEKFIKPGYPYPKMVIGKFIFDSSVYTNTLFECELCKLNNKEREWVLLVQDMLAYQNTNVILQEPIARYNLLHNLFQTCFTEDMVLQPCAIQLKCLYSVKEWNDIKKLARDLPYSVNGVLFAPYNTQYPVLFWEDTTGMLQKRQSYSQQQQQPSDFQQQPRRPNQKPFSSSSQTSSPRAFSNFMNNTMDNNRPTIPIPNVGNVKLNKKEHSQPSLNTSFFQQPQQRPVVQQNDLVELDMNSLLIDVEDPEEKPPMIELNMHELPLKEEVVNVPTTREFIVKKGAAPGTFQIVNNTSSLLNDLLHVPNIDYRKKLKTMFMDGENHSLTCKFNPDFNKWEPL